MSGIGLKIDDAALKRIGQPLQELLRRARDTHGMMDEVGAAVVVSTTHRFETGRGPDGEPWEPSAAAWGSTTAEDSGKTLVGRGHLRDSITHDAGADSVTIGSNVVYARIHQLGGTIKPKNGEFLHFKIGGGWVRVREVTMPARPYLGLDDDDRGEIGEIVQDYLGGAFEGAQA